MIKVKAAQFFVARAVERIISGRSVGRNNNNNNSKFQDVSFLTEALKSIFQHTLYPYMLKVRTRPDISSST